MDKRVHIIQHALDLFAKNGLTDTSVDSIASYAKVSKKTIYFHFRSKEILIREAFSWKMSGVSQAVDEVIEMDLPAIDKMGKYLQVICDKISDISIKAFYDLSQLKSLSKNAANEYMKRAVFIRFNKLLEQVKHEGYFKSGADIGSALMTYWNMLSPFLFMDLKKDVPNDLKNGLSLSDILRKQLTNLYKSFLTSDGVERLDNIINEKNLRPHADSN